MWCRRLRHLPLTLQHDALRQKLRGHFGNYGIKGNHEALARFWWEVRRTWYQWLCRRSQWGRMSWDDFQRLLGV